MATEYDVRANLTLKDRGFSNSANRAATRIRRLTSMLLGANRGGSSLFGTLTRVALTFGGLSAIAGIMRRGASAMFSFQGQVESTRIGLQSIISAVDHISFEEAGRSASAIWTALASDALRSTATTQEMFGIFQAIVGPIRAAGASLQTVRSITGSTVAAASALGVDFAQASRDIGLMVRGTAGMDTRMFSLLRSMGLITQTTQEWNQSLTTSQRITELQRALGSFDAAAAAYGQSFAGASSSFKDIVQQLAAAFAAPIFDRFRRYLLDINRWLLANRTAITTYLTGAGQAAASAIERVVNGARSAFQSITSQWTAIVARFQDIRAALVANAPALRSLASAMVGVSALRTALAPILSVFGGIMTVVQGVGALFGGGGAAGGAAGAGAGAAGGASGAAGAGGAAAGGAALGPVLVILAAVAAMGTTLVSYWKLWKGVLGPLIPLVVSIWKQLVELAGMLWQILKPILKIIGTGALLLLVTMLYAFLIAVKLVLIVINALAGALAWVMRAFDEYVVDPIITGILRMARAVSQFFSTFRTGRWTNANRIGQGGHAARRRMSAAAGARVPGPDAATMNATIAASTPAARPSTTNNFHRGSVQVRQEFRSADPDRVLVRMTNDLNRAATQRVGSGFAPAGSR